MTKLNEILEEHDFSLLIETTSNLGTTLNKAEIEGSLLASGHSLPLSASIRFGLTDGNRYFLVFYMLDKDTYVYERLTEAT